MMLHFDPSLPAAGLTGIGAFVLAEATGTGDPLGSLAIAAPIAAFAVWMVRWNFDRQAKREDALLEQQKLREEREDRRAEQVDLQTKALQECVTELRLMRDQLMQQGNAIDKIPERVAAVTGHGST